MVDSGRLRALRGADRDVAAQETQKGDARELAAQEVYGEKIYDVAEAARVLEVDQSTIRRHVASGDIIAFKLGKKWRITQADLYDFVASLRQDRLQKVREERLTREINSKVSRLKGNQIAAQEWGLTTCRQCTKMILVRQQEFHWHGDCPWCSDRHDLQLDDVKSLATVEKERVVAAVAHIDRLKEYYSSRPELARTHTHTHCRRPQCYRWVVLALEDEETNPHWKGRCDVCGYQHDLPRASTKSLAEQQAEVARQERLRNAIQQELNDAEQDTEAAQRIAKVTCSNDLCRYILALHLEARNGEERWVGVCPFCSTDQDQPRSALLSLAEAQKKQAFDDNNMDDIPF